ncbi:MAG: hypothetical protein ACYTEQ_28420, partial [Planctomycetota bacterium]
MTVDLSGMYLTDNLGNPTKWRIPDGVTIDPCDFLVFWADAEDGQGDFHTNFRLDAGGDQLAIFNADGWTLIDSIDFDELPQTTDISYGRYPDGSGNWRYLATPTPGYEN